MKNVFSYFRIIPIYIRKFRYNRNYGAFLIFLFMSTIFWFLNELENVYVTTIKFPVNYTEPPREKIFVGDLPSHLELQIRGTGFKLLEYKIGKEFMPIDFPVSSYNLESQDQEHAKRHYILTRSVRSSLSQELNSDLEIVDINPDTLYFQFAREGTKEVPVISNVSYSLGKQLMLRDKILMVPDSVKISGPITVLDTLDSVRTQHTQFEEVNSTVSKTVGLIKTHPQLEYDTKKIKVTIPVEQFTEGEIRKEIQVKNVPDSVVLRTFPRYVQVTYLVGLSKYEDVVPELFKVTVDFNQVKKDSDKLTVRIENAPGYLKSYSYSPHKVDYIIEKKND